MSGFIRRFTEFPPQDVLTAIEGINIIDLAPPASVNGVSTNVVALVGEFADMGFATTVDASGNVTTFVEPQEVFSGQDMIDKFGGFDSTLGNFGGNMGNGYAELRNKKFGRLVIAPINLCSAAGIRLWRQLPTNKSATDPTPVVPVAAANVAAGYLFKDTVQVLERIKTGQRVQFSAAIAYLTGIDGAVTNAAPAATNTFTSAGGGFTTIARPDGKTGVQVGDILVTGVFGATAPQGTDNGTWRVVSITSDTVIVVQNLDGTNFAWTTTSAGALVWRLHPASTADSYGEGLLSNQGTFSVPVRPLTNDAGTGASGTDGNWAINTQLSPVIAPPALTASSADPLSGLAGKIGPTTLIAFTSAKQKANAANTAAIDTEYSLAFDALKADELPSSEVAHVWAARKSSNIRSALKTHVLTVSSIGVGRTCSISPDVSQLSLTTVTGTADPGVGGNRDERVFYHWPATRTFIPEAVGIVLACSDGTTTSDGIIDVTSDGWMSSIMGNLAPERNPGESTTTTQTVLSPVLGPARGTPKLDINAWSLMRSRGISGIRIDKTVGPVFQSGITSSNIAGKINIARRKIADYIEDSLAQALKPSCKLPMSNQMKDTATSQVVGFLEQMLSADNPAAQRIASYLVDDKSANTKASLAKGIFIIIVKVQSLASADFIVIQCSIGEGVVTTSQVS